MNIKNFLLAIIVAIVATSCSTPKLGYFQDLQAGTIDQIQSPSYITIQPGDRLSIIVSSKNPELAYIFNLNIVSNYQASTNKLATNSMTSYTVTPEGNIEFPVLGTLHIAGLNKSEIASLIRSELISKNLLNDAIVTVNFIDLYFGVMGEVNHPGRFPIDQDKVTIIEALSRAGDLTIYGKRDNVLLIREENGKQMAYRINLTNANELYNSPAFYLKQGDMVYVEPNSTRINQSTVSGNSIRTPSFWFSVISVITSLSVLIFK